jgi:heme exporter protein B
LTILVVRDARLATRAGGGAALALAFLALVATLVPLSIGPEPNLLARVGGGVLWIAALLSALLSLDRLFQADFEDGSLDLIALSPLSLESVSTAKVASHWLTTGLPIALVSPFFALLLGLRLAAAETLFLSLLIGTPAVSAIGAIGAALTLSVRRGGLVLSLVVLPLLAPALIFGAGMVLDAGSGLSDGAPLFLAAFSLAAVLLSPFAAAAALRLNLAG